MEFSQAILNHYYLLDHLGEVPHGQVDGQCKEQYNTSKAHGKDRADGIRDPFHGEIEF